MLVGVLGGQGEEQAGDLVLAVLVLAEVHVFLHAHEAHGGLVGTLGALLAVGHGHVVLEHHIGAVLFDAVHDLLVVVVGHIAGRRQGFTAQLHGLLPGIHPVDELVVTAFNDLLKYGLVCHVVPPSGAYRQDL